jgi:manganese-dependent inorganic pyrophosphatase
MQKKQVADISINGRDSLRELYNLMYQNNLDTMPVVDDSSKVIGLITPKDILKFNLDKQDTLKILKYKNITFNKIKNLLDAEVLCGEKLLNDTIKGSINMGVYSYDETRRTDLKDAMVLVGDREDIHEEVINQEAKALVITKGKKPSERIIQLAKEKDLIILATKHGTSSSTKLIEQSYPVEDIMSKDFISFDVNDKIDDIQSKARNSKQQIFPITSKGKFVGVVSIDEILKPHEKEFILVDHNSPEQFAKGIKRENIKEIVDHHRQEFLPVSGRIPTTYSDVGANATVIAKHYKANSVEIPKEIAGMLWCAIASDTNGFTSSTTTFEDRQIARELLKISRPIIKDSKELINSMFEQRDKAVSSLTPEELVIYDRKTFRTTSGESYSINQITIGNDTKYINMTQEIKRALNELEEKNSFGGAVTMISNTKNLKTTLVCSKKLQNIAQKLASNLPIEFEEKHIKDTKHSFEEVINKIAQTGVVELENAASRKEQIEPFIRELYENC